jgi:hypothetical protein
MAAHTAVERASLLIYEPPTGDSTQPGGRLGEIKFQFNPSELSLSKSTSWIWTPAVSSEDGGQPEFQGADPHSLSLQIFLDSTADPGASTVRESVELLFSCLEVTEPSISAKAPSPPWVRFHWGTFATVGFVAYVRDLAASYTVFSSSGNPIRATCRLTLQEIPQRTPGQNPTSGALTARKLHRLVAGDTLQSLAWREYGNVAAWRTLAEVNDIDDPMRLTLGTELLLPAAEEIR